MSSPGPTASNSPFLKQLASSSSKARAEALEHLRTYLRSQSSLTTLDYLKLWKGLFYCVWHSDRPKAQQALAQELASLVRVLATDEATEAWLSAFWETMAREWGGIPALRMDKFLYLCRCYVGAGFEWCKRGRWVEERLGRLNGVVEKVPLSSEIERRDMTNGLRFHVLDVWVDELERCHEEDVEMPLEMLMSPVERLRRETRDKAVRTRAQEALNDERLKDLANGAQLQDEEVRKGEPMAAAGAERVEAEEGNGEEWGGIEAG